MRAAFDRLIPDPAGDGVAHADVVIEAIFENVEAKHALFKSLEPRMKLGALLATPESRLDQLGARMKKPTWGIEEMEKELRTTKEVLDKIKIFMEQRKKIIENTPSLWPVNGYIVSSFGKRSSQFSSREDFNKGIDIAAYPGAEIHATAPGTVDAVKWEPGVGLTVSIRHKYGFTTVYSHCQRVSVEDGQKVSKGETIAYVGRTGRATQHICKYQVIIGTDSVDPMPYLNKINRDVQ